MTRFYLFLILMIGAAGTAAADTPCIPSTFESQQVGGAWTVCRANTGQGAVRVIRGAGQAPDVEVDAAPAANQIVQAGSVIVINRGAPQGRLTRLQFKRLRAQVRNRPNRLRCNGFTCYSPGWR